MMEKYSQIAIDQTDGPTMTTLIEGAPGKVSRLRSLVISLASTGTIQLRSGSNALTGPMPLLGTAAFRLSIQGPEARDNCLASAPGEGLVLVTSQKAFGFAIVSQEV